MSEFVMSSLLLLCGLLVVFLVGWWFRRSKLLLWGGVVATLAMIGLFGAWVIEGRLSSPVEFGAFLVFIIAATYGFWRRFSDPGQTNSD